MDCVSVKYSGHAMQRMFERGITRQSVAQVIRSGSVVETYPADQPFPSALLFGCAAGRPLHVVVARQPDTALCLVVTAYEPDPDRWEPDWRTRRTP